MQNRIKQGVTFVEMLIVFIVAGLVMAMGLPRFHSVVERNGVTSAREQVLSALNTARSTAVRRGANTTFNASGNEVWVTVDSSGTEVTLVSKISLLTSHSVTLSTSGNTSKIAYNMRGLSSDAAGRIYLTRGSKKDSICVTQLGGATSLACPS
jgi:type IV fimbrial biogenesis protein FimT